MSNVNSLILPSTIPDRTHIRQLLLFSEKVFQYAPSEDSVDTEAVAVSKKLYNHYPPAPFNEGLETFQKFIKDLTSYRAEYYTGALSNLSNGLSTDLDESNVWHLINKFAQESSPLPQAEKLMHARLLIKLAEIHHREDQEINAALASVDNQVNTIFTELKNEVDETIAELPSGGTQIAQTNPLQLLKAWFHLFLADTSATVFPIIATDEETFSTLNEYTSNLIAPQQNILCTLSTPKPCFSVSDETFYTGLKEFRQTKQAEIKKLQTALLQAANSNAAPGDAEDFNTALTAHFGTSREPAINLYRLPLSLPQLAAKVTNATAPPTHNHPPHTIVAVLA